jgi:Protein of unknown function (DUF5661)
MNSFTHDDARRIGAQIGIDWESAPFDVEQFRMGMDVELEHSGHDPATDVTGDDRSSPPRSHSLTSTSSLTTTRGSSRWRSRQSGITAPADVRSIRRRSW